MYKRGLQLLSCFVLMALAASAQIVVGLQTNKATYTVGESITLTASVSNGLGGSTTGVVNFTLQGDSGQFPLGQAQLANGIATYSTSVVSAGNFTVGASFVGINVDGSPSGLFGNSSQVPFTVASTYAYSVLLSATPAAILPGDTVRISATVVPAQGAVGNPDPQGIVAFFVKGLLIGSVDLTGGNPAVINIGGLSEGDNPVQAQFVGSSVDTFGTANAEVIVPVGVRRLLNAVPSRLVFYMEKGGPAPESKTYPFTSPQIPINYTAQVETGTWLQVTPAAGTTPVDLTLSVNAAGLDAGTYKTNLYIDAGSLGRGYSEVTLVITDSPKLFSVPQTLTFSYNRGGLEPPSQLLFVAASSRSPADLTLSTQTAWLEIVKPTADRAAFFQIRANVSGLSLGTYDGSITVHVNEATYTDLVIPVKLSILPPTKPLVSATGAVNSATQGSIAVGPNSIFSLYGDGLGGAGITKVYLQGRSVPIYSAQPDQINFLVPDFINGYPSATIEVEVLGVKSDAVNLPARFVSPGIFTANSAGKGQASALNQDSRPNDVLRPAKSGSIVQFFVTGFGIPGLTGRDGLVRLLLPVGATVGGVPCIVEFAGPAPSLGNGVQQINVRLAKGVPTGAAVPVVLNVGGVDTQPGVTIAVQ